MRCDSYKWIVCDLDGTLLNSEKKISYKDKKAIDMFKKKGKGVIIATGRHDLIANKYLMELGLDTPIIACNGALIKDVYSSTILYKKLIEPAKAQEIIKFCEENRLDYLVYTIRAIYYSENSKRINVVRDYNSSAPQSLKAPIFSVKNLDVYKEEIIKVLISSADKSIFEKVKQLNKDKKLTAVSSESGLLDIMTSGISKGKSLVLLSKYLNMDLKYTAVFGDGYNDMSMFEVAGLSIAMDNAAEELKERADITTLSNDDSGVGHAVYKYFL